MEMMLLVCSRIRRLEVGTAVAGEESFIWALAALVDVGYRLASLETMCAYSDR